MRLPLLLWSLFALVLLLRSEAEAQTATPFPREILTPEAPERADPTAPALVVPEGQAGVSVPDSGASFVLRGVEITGSSVYDDATLQAAVAGWIGRPARFSDIRALSDAIEALYRDDGYLATRAVVPAQEIEGGVLRVTIIEGVIETIALRGDLGRAEPKVRELLAPLVGRKPLKWAEAERRLLLARDLPGVSLIASLRAVGSDSAGGLALVVDAGHDPFDAFLSTSNYSSPSVGPWVVTGGAGANSLLVPGDRLEGIGLFTPDIGEQEVVLLSYEVPVLTDGLVLRASGSATWSEPGDVLDFLEIDYNAWTARIEAEYAMLRTRERSFWLSAGLDATWQESDVEAFPFLDLDIDEELRVAFVGGRYVTNQLLGGVTDIKASVRKGLSILGASEEGDDGLSPPGSDPEFLSAQASVDFDRALTPDWTLATRVAGQVGDDLPSLERFSLGNYTIGRGFEPGLATGDSGIAGSVEVERHFDYAVTGRVSGTSAFGFLEGGKAWIDDGDESVASVGLGLRATVFDRIDLEGALAVPLDKPRFDENSDVRFLFRAQTLF